MYSTLTLGSIALPTAPIFALLAWLTGLEVAGRFGKQLNLDLNDIWNTGLIAIIGGSIVARLWNVARFWPVYSSEPLLIFSLRPSGFDLFPGLIAALIAAYAYLLYKALDPLSMVAAASVGSIATMLLLAISNFLTGEIVGIATHQPWATNYFGESVHPAGLYRGLGFLVLLFVLPMLSKRIIGSKKRTAETIILSIILGCALVRLIADGFVRNTEVVAGLRISQIIALLVALVATWFLAQLYTTQSTTNISESI